MDAIDLHVFPGLADPSIAPQALASLELRERAVHTHQKQVERLLPLTDWFVSAATRDTWQMRAQQVREQPRDLDWVTGVIMDVRQLLAVGKAGFHAAPDRAGLVEVGYAVDPLFRRQGYARAALRAMLARARSTYCVSSVRASISPDNAASRALVASLGFVVVGEQWDERDGLELIHERTS